MTSGSAWELESVSPHDRTGVPRVAERAEVQTTSDTEAGSIELFVGESAVPTRTITWNLEELEGQSRASAASGTEEVDP